MTVCVFKKNGGGHPSPGLTKGTTKPSKSRHNLNFGFYLESFSASFDSGGAVNHCHPQGVHHNSRVEEAEHRYIV